MNILTYIRSLTPFMWFVYSLAAVFLFLAIVVAPQSTDSTLQGFSLLGLAGFGIAAYAFTLDHLDTLEHRREQKRKARFNTLDW